MRTKEQIKQYHKYYAFNKMWTCVVCCEDMLMRNKFRHLVKDYHLINVENMIALGLEVPEFKRSASKDWKCTVCDDGYSYKNRYQHCLSLKHKNKEALLTAEGLQIPSIKVNEDFMPNFSKQSIPVKR